MRGPRRAPALVLALVAACARPASARTTFEVVPPGDDASAIDVHAASPAEARAELLAALDARTGAPSVRGRAPWSTVAVVDEGDTAGALAAGRTFARLGAGDLHFDVRLGAGSVSTSAGGSIVTSAERALLEVRVEDPSTPHATFRIEIHADERAGGMPPVDVTPGYLRRALPRGRYRAFIDVPARGARWVVGVTVLDGDGDDVAHAWASPLTMSRP